MRDDPIAISAAMSICWFVAGSRLGALLSDGSLWALYAAGLILFVAGGLQIRRDNRRSAQDAFDAESDPWLRDFRRRIADYDYDADPAMRPRRERPNNSPPPPPPREGSSWPAPRPGVDGDPS